MTLSLRARLKNGGRKGGSKKSLQKTLAARANGKLGGRPRLYPICKHYENRSHRFFDDLCVCGYRRQ